MTRLLQSLGSDVERAMTDVNVPSYIIDRNGVVAWLNPAAESIVGDVRGMRFTDVVTPGDRPRAKEAFARKILGKEKVTDAEVDLVGADGRASFCRGELGAAQGGTPDRRGVQAPFAAAISAQVAAAAREAHAAPARVLGLLAHGPRHTRLRSSCT